MGVPSLDLLVIGEINPDLLVTGPDVEPEFGQVEKLVSRAKLAVGSSSVITACAAARLGLRTGFAGVVGEDPLGRFMLDAMRERGIEVRGCVVDPDQETGVTVVLSDEARGRAILTAPGAMARFRAEDVDPDLVGAARHVHCAGYFLQPALHAGLPDLFATARRAGATTSLDPNWDPAETWDVRDVIAQADLFVPNEAELLAITGAGTLEDAVADLARPDLTVAVKRGAAGGEWHRGPTHLRLPAPAIDAVDTTGAGDAFTAGLLHAFLNGEPPERQLALAVATGSLATRALGGVDAQPDLIEAHRLAAVLDLEGSRT
jgi:sugar/nucleoside kinase (ribokinase family)